MTLNIQWTANIANSLEEKKAFEAYILGNTKLLDRLKTLIEEKERAIYLKSISSSSYKESDWAAVRAHNDGRLYELNEFKQLLTIG